MWFGREFFPCPNPTGGVHNDLTPHPYLYFIYFIYFLIYLSLRIEGL